VTFRELVIDNPLQIEFKRAFRRFFGVSRNGTLNAAILVLCVMVYSILMLVVITYREFMSPIAILILQLIMLTFIVPANLHGAIAAEREKRTWDMLLVAPITNAQIVIGKMIGGVLLLLFVSALLIPATVLSFAGDNDATFGKVLAAEAVVLGFAFFLAALSVFISARTKRAFAAQLTIYAVLILGLIVWPIFTSVLVPYREQGYLLFMHPYYALVRIWDPGSFDSMGSGNSDQALFTGWLQLLVYLGAAAVLTQITIQTLTNSDGDAGPRR
jgi:ABC-type transport system involved in multi-copper enzyme maturation permease subunit